MRRIAHTDTDRTLFVKGTNRPTGQGSRNRFLDLFYGRRLTLEILTELVAQCVNLFVRQERQTFWRPFESEVCPNDFAALVRGCILESNRWSNGLAKGLAHRLLEIGSPIFA